jgi:hypothetical protein
LGIVLENIRNATITKMTLLGNNDGVVNYNYPVVITDTIANNNLTAGLYLTSNNNVVYNTQASHNGFYGMYSLPDGDVISNSQTNYNGYYGITAGRNITIINSQANFNSASTPSGAGITATGPSRIINSEANHDKAKNASGGDGFRVPGPGDSLVGNTADGNGSQGISLSCPGDLVGNIASGNPGGNIVLTPVSTGCARSGNNPGP